MTLKIIVLQGVKLFCFLLPQSALCYFMEIDVLLNLVINKLYVEKLNLKFEHRVHTVCLQT